MTNFLVKTFVKDYEKTDNIKVRERYGTLSSVVGIVCNIILFVAKFAMGTLAGSIAIISDGFNNLSDCASCVVTLFGYKMAAKPADKDHPFGHGRVEYLTSLVIAIVIIMVGFELFTGSIDKVLHPTKVTFSYVVLATLIISIVVKVWMGLFNRKLGKKINSSVMLATSKDSMNDVVATSATVVALVASMWTDAPIDGIMGIVVSLFILLSGFDIVKETVDELLGQPADEELVTKLSEMVEENPYALGMHDLIIHSYGPGNLIGSVHIEVDGKGNIMEIHDVIDELERDIYEELGVRMTIHMDPVEMDNELLNECKNMMIGIVKNINKDLSLHDFRMVTGPSHTNLIFDLVVPHDCKLNEKDIKTAINDSLKDKEIKYYTVITFEREFC
ncbi:MAG: cation transporter [Lachnospiraceae bacterium]|nr:cation transporter [Lachnospiraceae bacterium]